MQSTRKITRLFILFLLTPVAYPVMAALHDRGGGLVYDDVLDITWMQDTGLANAQLGQDINWASANAWAANLVFAGYSDWRLPNMDIDDDGSFVDCKDAAVTELACRDNEFSYMYVYNGITNPAPGGFISLGVLYYWSSTDSQMFPGLAMLFRFNTGFGGITSKITVNRHAWAVRDGDSVAPVADGDLAPLGEPDGILDAGDLLVAIRIVHGDLVSTPLELVHGDVYPPGAPDGAINIQDLILIRQLVAP